MDDASAKLEACAEPIYHSIWGKDADELTLAPFTQNSGHPRSLDERAPCRFRPRKSS